MLTEAEVRRYGALSPFNVVHLTRPGTDYEGAARAFDRWLDEHILEVDQPSMYIHEVEFDGRVRRDLIAVLRLQPYEDRVVLPHERTHRGPKEDRLALLRATGVAFEPLWFLYEGARSGLPKLVRAAAAGHPGVAFGGPESTAHRFWVVSDPAFHSAVHDALAGLPVLIADGHHRYETALAYAGERGAGPDDPASYTLALLTDVADPGLVVLPTHRVLKSGVAVTGGEPKGSLRETLDVIQGRVAAGVYRDHRFQVLPLEGDVAVVELHQQVIENILGKRSLEENVMYTRDPDEAVRWVDEGAGTAAFFLGAPDLSQVLKVAQEGKTLPQKATYFHPKPPSGMLFDRLEIDRRL